MPSRRKLTREKVEQIRALKGKKTQREIAAQFGVADATIRDIYSGKSWVSTMRIVELTPEQVLEIRRLRKIMRVEDIAAAYGVSTFAIYRIHQGESYKHVQSATVA